MSARWVNRRGACEPPDPPTTPVRPAAWMLAMLIAVWPATAVALTCAFHCSVRVAPGGRSSFQVSSVVPGADCFCAGPYAAHPDGVIVQPRHGSSNPHPAHHASSCAGTVSQIVTFHQVRVPDML